jgi:hypothetical protein
VLDHLQNGAVLSGVLIDGIALPAVGPTPIKDAVEFAFGPVTRTLAVVERGKASFF